MQISSSNAPSVDGEPALRDYLRVLGRRKRTILCVIGLVVLAAVGSSLVQTDRYEARATVLIQPRQSAEQLAGADAPVVLDRKRVIDTEVEVMDSDAVRSQVEGLFGDGTPAATVGPVEGTDLVAVTVRSTDPALAQAVADATVSAYVDFRQETERADLLEGAAQVQEKITTVGSEIAARDDRLAVATGAEAATLRTEQDAAEARYLVLQQQAEELSLAASLTRSDADLIDPATRPSEPVAPQPLRALVLAILAGAVLGVALAFVLDLLDDRIDSKEDIERLVPGVPVLGLVPEYRPWRSADVARTAGIEDPEGPVAQSFRSLRTSLRFVTEDRDIRTIAVTSSLPGEGKTSTAVNLAVLFARSGAETVLVDGDLRRPRVHRFLGLENRKGLGDALLDGTSLEGEFHTVDDVPGLYVVTAGSPSAHPAELLQSDRTRILDQGLMADADVVIIDTPPVLAVADPLAVAGKVDAVLLVASVSGTSRRQLGRTAELLSQAGATVIGTVANRVPASDEVAYADYGYEAGAPRRSRAERFFRPAGA